MEIAGAFITFCALIKAKGMVIKVIKKRIFVLYFIISILTLTACTATPSNQSMVEPVLKVLTQPSWGGRQVGTEGNIRAGEYLKDLLNYYGYLPFKGTDYFMPFNMELPDSTAIPQFRINYGNGKTETLTPDIDFIFNSGLPAFSFHGKVISNPNEKGNASQAALFRNSEQSLSAPEGYGLILVSGDKFHYKPNGKGLENPYKVSISPETYDKLTGRDIASIDIEYAPKHSQGVANNVVGIIKGVDSGKAVILSAHFDGLSSFGNVKLTCAFDNGSGVAALTEIARQLAEWAKEETPISDIIICFFNAEEIFLTGSENFVGIIRSKYDDIYNINIDCLGAKNSGTLAIKAAGEESQSICDAVIDKLEEWHIPFNRDIVGGSDHMSFSSRGIPAVAFQQKDETEVAHTRDDQIENLDIGQIKEICGFISQFVIENDENSFGPSAKASLASADKTDWESIQMEADKLTGNMDLGFNEIFVFEYNGAHYRKSGNCPLRSEGELKKYYPAANISELGKTTVLSGFAVDSINIENENVGPLVEYLGEETGRIALDLKQENISAIRIGYAKGNYVIKITMKANNPEPDQRDLKAAALSGEYEGYEMYTQPDNNEINGFGFMDSAAGQYFYVEHYTREPIGEQGYLVANAFRDEDDVLRFIDAFDFRTRGAGYFESLFGKR